MQATDEISTVLIRLIMATNIPVQVIARPIHVRVSDAFQIRLPLLQPRAVACCSWNSSSFRMRRST